MHSAPSRAVPPLLAFYYFQPQVTLDLPAELSSVLTASGLSLHRSALEPIAVEAYRQDHSPPLNCAACLAHARFQVHTFLKNHDVYLRYGPADLEHDKQAGDALRVPPIP